MVEEADLPVGADQKGQGENTAAHTQADEAITGVVGATVGVGGALPVGPVTPRLQNVAAPVRAAIGVGATDVLRRDAAPDGLIADLAAPAVGVGTALRAGLQNRQAERSSRRAVGVRLAADTRPVAAADTVGTVPVVDAGDARAGGRVTGRRVAGALCRVHAVDAAVVGHVAALPGAVRVHAAPCTGSRRDVADAGGAVRVDHTPDARVALAVADLARRAIAVLQAAVARLIQAAAFAGGTVAVGQTLRATVRLDHAAPPVRAVCVLETGHAPGDRIAVQPRTTVRVFQTRGATPLRDPTASARTLRVFGALDARADGAAHTPHRAIGVGGAVHANGFEAASPLAAVLVDCAAHATVLVVAGRDTAAVDIGPAGDARLVFTDARRTVSVVEAGGADAARGVTAGLRTIGVVEAADTLRSRRVAAAVGAVPVCPAADAGIRRRVTDTATAVLVERAVDADTPGGIADPPAEAVAVPGTGHAGVRRGVADFVFGALLPAAALDTDVRAREADAARAVLVSETRDAEVRGAVAPAPRALGVLGALHTSTARKVAHADRAVLRRHAVDADAARGVTVARLATLGILDALSAEAPELRAASGGRGTRVVFRIAGRRAAGPHRVADLTGGARHGRAGLTRPAEAVRRYAVALGTAKADLAPGVVFARTRAEAAIGEFDAGRPRARALLVEFAPGAGGLAEGSAATRLRVAVLGLRARAGDAAVGLERHAHALGNLAPLPERAVVLRAAATRREDAPSGARLTGAEDAVRIRVALSGGCVALRPGRSVGAVFRDIGAAAHGHDQHREGEDEAEDASGVDARVTIREQQTGLLRPAWMAAKRRGVGRRAPTSPSAPRIRFRRSNPNSAPS